MAEKDFLQDPLTSRQNPTVKKICSLLDKKTRKKEKMFRFDGKKLFFEAVAKGLDIRFVVLNENIDDSLKSQISFFVESGKLDRRVIFAVSEQVFLKMSEENAPEGIITVASFLEDKHRKIEAADSYSIDGKARILIGESLRDPGNLGTVIRSAAALGIDKLILTDDCADLYSPKTVRAAMGGLFSLKIDTVCTGELALLVTRLRSSGRRIYATALRTDAKDIGSLELRSGDAFIIGNEGHGLSEAVIEASDGAVIIPMVEGNESLNAAAAATICIWETVRSR